MLVVSLLAVHIAFGAAANIGEAPVRRKVAKADDDDQPLSLGETVLDLNRLHKDWPHCQAQTGFNWNTADAVAKEQHLKKMHVVDNVSSAQACGHMCGSYTYKHGDANIPCATWSWVEKTWATEFAGFKSCAMFGFMQNDEGVVRADVSQLAFKSNCCVAGTPCAEGEKIQPYDISADLVAFHYRKEERRRRGLEKMARIAQAKYERDHPRLIAPPKQRIGLLVAGVLGLGFIIGVFAWRHEARASYVKA